MMINRNFRNTTLHSYSKVFYSSENLSSTKNRKRKTAASTSNKSNINKFFKTRPYLQKIKEQIPKILIGSEKIKTQERLYLMDQDVAQKASTYILPIIKQNPNQIICETNAGLGLIAKELLNNDVKLIRLYESCNEFKTILKNLNKVYPGRIELFTKDILLLSQYDRSDQEDNGDRVQQLLTGVPKKTWTDDPVMTIIGTMANPKFLRYLIKSLVLQNHVTSQGRFELFLFMKPKDFIKLTAGPDLNLHTYGRLAVLFSLFFECELLDKFPRQVFLPWPKERIYKTNRYVNKIDPDLMYFTRLHMKKELPVSADNLLRFYDFVMHLFQKSTSKVIPTVESWVHGSGLSVIVPNSKYPDYYKNMSIFTGFGELTPKQILYVYQEVVAHPGYKETPFLPLRTQFLKAESIPSPLYYELEKNIIEDIEVKVD